ncbi:hypothetical protein AUJ46_01055 [Candidatus Peregrinibacteria bacterium CG1_02_54_53]|nr:MAG: hypothetical protein AUJ46_01055 [Candidatus Peregrinibacteria bacterium CG1_02_54_53]
MLDVLPLHIHDDLAVALATTLAAVDEPGIGNLIFVWSRSAFSPKYFLRLIVFCNGNHGFVQPLADFPIPHKLTVVERIGEDLVESIPAERP